MEQLLRVARLDAIALDVSDTVDQNDVAASVVAAMAPWALTQCSTIALAEAKAVVLTLQRRARQEHRSSDLLQHRVIGDEFVDARLDTPLRHLAELQSEPAQDAA